MVRPPGPYVAGLFGRALGQESLEIRRGRWLNNEMFGAKLCCFSLAFASGSLLLEGQNPVRATFSRGRATADPAIFLARILYPFRNFCPGG